MVAFVRHIPVKLWDMFVWGIPNRHLRNGRIAIRESSSAFANYSVFSYSGKVPGVCGRKPELSSVTLNTAGEITGKRHQSLCICNIQELH